MHPATEPQKVGLALYLLVLAVVLLWNTGVTINKVNAEVFTEFSLSWESPSGITLLPGPPGFRYDPVQKKLSHRGVINAERKMALRELFSVGATPPLERIPDTTSPKVNNKVDRPPDEAPREKTQVSPEESAGVETSRHAYYKALDDLADLSASRQGVVISLLMLLGGMGGALGAVLRSLVDFVGHACYTLKLDLVRWWPLYFTRPLVGAILGFIIIVLIKGQLLTAVEARPTTDSFWWLGVAIIGGFSTVDVTLRLRLAAKALFGVESGATKPAAGAK
jgi:hypothetical protein